MDSWQVAEPGPEHVWPGSCPSPLQGFTRPGHLAAPKHGSQNVSGALEEIKRGRLSSLDKVFHFPG